MSAYEENINEFIQANSAGIKAAIEEAREGVAIAVMPNGSRKSLTAEDNWLEWEPKPNYIVFKNPNTNQYGIIITENLLGEGATCNVYPSALLSENGEVEEVTVAKVLKPGVDANILTHEAQFKTDDIQVHTPVIQVGRLLTTVFNYVPGKSLVSKIEDEGIRVEQALLHLSFEDRCQFMMDLCAKLDAMHTGKTPTGKSFCYLDLNFDNVLVEIDENGYKACHIIDHGESQFLPSEEEAFEGRFGKFFWNAKEANQLASVRGFRLILNPKIDIVPLGVMGYIIFAARENISDTDYNLFSEKQEAYRRVDFKGIFAIRAVSNVPFVINANFIVPDEWNLKIATADRMNELMKVFFERMVSDDPEDRPSAEEARQIFSNIQELYRLNHALEEEASIFAIFHPEENLLKECQALAFPSPINGQFSEAIAPVIRQLKHILSSPEYLSSQEDNFCREKIALLIKLKQASDSSMFAMGVSKWNSLLDAILLMDRMIAEGPSNAAKKRSKIDFIVAFMEAQSLNEEILNFLKKEQDFYKKYPNARNNLKVDIQRLRMELQKISAENGYEKTAEFQEKSSEFNEKLLFQMERDHLIAKAKCLKRKVDFVKESVSANFGMKMEDMNSSEDEIQALKSEIESEDEEILEPYKKSEELGEKEKAHLIQNKKFILNVKICMSEICYSENICQGYTQQGQYEDYILKQQEYKNAFQRYEQYLNIYKECLKNLLRPSKEDDADQGNEISVELQSVKEKSDPVLAANRAFLDAVARESEKHPKNKKELAIILNYQANELRNLVVAMEPHKGNEVELAKPVPCTEAQYVGAMQELEEQGKTDLVALGLMSLGIILGVTMVVTAAIAITAFVGITCPPALLALPVIGPMLTSAFAAPMFVAATAAISTLGYVAGVALGIKKQKDSEKALPKEMANADQLVRAKHNSQFGGTVANNPYLFMSHLKKNKENEKDTPSPTLKA